MFFNPTKNEDQWSLFQPNIFSSIQWLFSSVFLLKFCFVIFNSKRKPILSRNSTFNQFMLTSHWYQRRVYVHLLLITYVSVCMYVCMYEYLFVQLRDDRIRSPCFCARLQMCIGTSVLVYLLSVLTKNFFLIFWEEAYVRLCSRVCEYLCACTCNRI